MGRRKNQRKIRFFKINVNKKTKYESAWNTSRKYEGKFIALNYAYYKRIMVYINDIHFYLKKQEKTNKKWKEQIRPKVNRKKEQ